MRVDALGGDPPDPHVACSFRPGVVGLVIDQLWLRLAYWFVWARLRLRTSSASLLRFCLFPRPTAPAFALPVVSASRTRGRLLICRLLSALAFGFEVPSDRGTPRPARPTLCVRPPVSSPIQTFRRLGQLHVALVPGLRAPSGARLRLRRPRPAALLLCASLRPLRFRPQLPRPLQTSAPPTMSTAREN